VGQKGGKMLPFLDSKNKKLVKRWKKEHEQLIILGKKVLAEYVKNDEKKIRNALQAFTDLAMEHFNNEDIELYRLLNDPSRKSEKLKASVDKFQDSFKNIKLTLMKFLATYNREERPIDEEFFDNFSQIMEILSERIAFEEGDLYFFLSMK
jgi:cobalamin biosynthesis Co2+ chelatase CbiK